MRHYTVHARAVPAGTDPDFVLVKEGFNWPALFVPVLWLLYRAQWLGLAAYLGGATLLSVGAIAIGLGEGAQGLLALLYALLVAAEANDWRRWRLTAAGYRLAGVVIATDLEMAEARWLAFNDTGAATAKATATSASQAADSPTDPQTPSRSVVRRDDPLQPFATPFDRV